MSADKQIAGATNVSVAQVVSAAPQPGGGVVEYGFLVLQRLAGPNQSYFTVMGVAPGHGNNSNFENHSAPAFWTRGGGRVMNDADCKIHPDFLVGESYLVFRDLPITRRSFEKIEVVDGVINQGDKWLSYVRSALGSTY